MESLITWFFLKIIAINMHWMACIELLRKVIVCGYSRYTLASSDPELLLFASYLFSTLLLWSIPISSYSPFGYTFYQISKSESLCIYLWRRARLSGMFFWHFVLFDLLDIFYVLSSKYYTLTP